MKRFGKILSMSVAASLLALAGDHAALGATSSGTVAVSATVVKNCTMTNGSIAFTGYDPAGANAVANLDVASTGFAVACTKGVAYSISLDLGANATGAVRRMKDASANFLSYEVYSDAARTTVWNATNLVSGVAASKNAITLNAFGRVPGGQDVPVGTYNDTVNAVVTF